MNSSPYVQKRKWPYVVAVIIVICLIAGWGVYRIMNNLSDFLFKQTDIGGQLVQELVEEAAFGGDSEIAGLLPLFLGFDKPRTYLVLFQNNTELRPSGGFIGVYAVIRMDKGKMELLKLEGTEILDWETPDDWRPVPPQPITDYLGVDRWYFRDSNWSPDFPTAAQKALELYTGEGGVYADEIDTVLAITPTVFERVLKLTGPVTVEGKTFTPENAIETLEYEVEYAYKDSGRTVEQRKDIIVPLTRAVVQRAAFDGFLNPEKYMETLQALFDEKHILAYSLEKPMQKIFEDEVWAGRVVTTTGDYLMWVDANLGALKTDHAMNRTLKYEISVAGFEYASGRATMTYTHNGSFDWRTTRYLTYARVFVPEGAELWKVFEIQGAKRVEVPLERVDTGTELGHTWFGTFIRIEPGQEKDVMFSYALPDRIAKQIQAANYSLVVQKQPGTHEPRLTLSLGFGKNVTAADPPETEKNWGDEVYLYDTDLSVDRVFNIAL